MNRLAIIGVTEIPRVYSKRMRREFALGAVYMHVWLSQKARLAVDFAKAKEHAYWLVGDEHPTQNAN